MSLYDQDAEGVWARPGYGVVVPIEVARDLAAFAEALGDHDQARRWRDYADCRELETPDRG